MNTPGIAHIAAKDKTTTMLKALHDQGARWTGAEKLTSEVATMPQHHVSRRWLFATVPALLLAVGCAQAASAQEIVVYKTPWCGCCKAWVTHMTRAGFRPVVKELQDLAPVRERYGIPFELSSCHTGVVGGYVIEGHVPAEDVARLLKARPKALGLTVPGMPIGSPGMEQPSGVTEPFDTLLLLDSSGRTQVFARHT